MNFSGKSITKNTIYNLFGYGIPMLIAVAIIPHLIDGLGIERFGVLSLAWMVVGYFSLFDFGISKSLTKLTAEKIGQKQFSQIPGLFWTSLLLMLGISIIFVILLLFFVPSLVNLFKISKELHSESLKTFYVLVLSIPIVSTTSGLRGVLEAYQEFGIINVMRVILGISTFSIPLICLIFTKSLFWIILMLILIRVIVWVCYLLLCLKVNVDIKKYIKFKPELVQYILRFGIWITFANIVGPLIISVDRFLIGTQISAEAVTFYATPYEVVTKLLIIPNSLVAVLFPIFSSSFVQNDGMSNKIFIKGVKFIFLILYPIILLLVCLSHVGIEVWLGPGFVDKSAKILQLLSIGVFLNAIAYIPFNFFQGVGKPQIPAILNLIELPFYLLAMWLAIQNYGVLGVAYIWLVRIIFDTAILFFLVYKNFKINFNPKLVMFLFLFSFISLVLPLFVVDICAKIIFGCICLITFVLFVWKYFMKEEEKNFLIRLLKVNSEDKTRNYE